RSGMKQWKPTPLAIRKMKGLRAERSSRGKMKKQLLNQQREYKRMKDMSLDGRRMKLNKKLSRTSDWHVTKIETEIEKTVELDEQLKSQSKLIRSVTGVGKVVSWMMLAKTEAFSLIDDPRKMACYCGVVPFEFQSGTSIRNRPRVSMYADRSMKSVLHLAAMSAIRLNN